MSVVTERCTQMRQGQRRHATFPPDLPVVLGGHAYFELTLRSRFGLEASYFTLHNEHWQLIGLGTGDDDHGLKDPRREWFGDTNTRR